MQITPAHDANDFATGKRHGLAFINILDDDGNINQNGALDDDGNTTEDGAQFVGRPRFEVRSPRRQGLNPQALALSPVQHKARCERRCINWPGGCI